MKKAKTFFTLSKKEDEIMQVMWTENRPMSGADIKAVSVDKSWHTSSLYIMLNSLVKKGAIELDGFVQSQTNYSRTFRYALSKSEYSFMQIKKMLEDSDLSTVCLLEGLLDGEENKAVVFELKEMLNRKYDGME